MTKVSAKQGSLSTQTISIDKRDFKSLPMINSSSVKVTLFYSKFIAPFTGIDSLTVSPSFIQWTAPFQCPFSGSLTRLGSLGLPVYTG